MLQGIFASSCDMYWMRYTNLPAGFVMVSRELVCRSITIAHRPFATAFVESESLASDSSRVERARSFRLQHLINQEHTFGQGVGKHS